MTTCNCNKKVYIRRGLTILQNNHQANYFSLIEVVISLVRDAWLKKLKFLLAFLVDITAVH